MKCFLIKKTYNSGVIAYAQSGLKFSSSSYKMWAKIGTLKSAISHRIYAVGNWRDPKDQRFANWLEKEQTGGHKLDIVEIDLDSGSIITTPIQEFFDLNMKEVK